MTNKFSHLIIMPLKNFLYPQLSQQWHSILKGRIFFWCLLRGYSISPQILDFAGFPVKRLSHLIDHSGKRGISCG
jgi:hypothetical protein